MKTHLLLLCGLLGGAASPHSSAQSSEPAATAPLLNPAQLEQLLAPIALYPDALIAVMLPAATSPADLVLAARFLAEAGEGANLEGKTWEESVKSLAHFHSVLKWMDQNLAWTKQLGEAFRDQPAEVMQAIQRLRAKARAAGTLGDTAQQSVVVEGDVISIVPAQANAIYLPYYDPAVVYYHRPGSFYPGGYFTFGGAISVGSWLSFECDWWNRKVWVAPRRPADAGPRDWRRPIFPGRPGYAADPDRRAWRPAPSAHRPAVPAGNDRPRNEAPVPTPPSHPPSERKVMPTPRETRPTREIGPTAPPTAVAPGSNQAPTGAVTTPPCVADPRPARSAPDQPKNPAAFLRPTRPRPHSPPVVHPASFPRARARRRSPDRRSRPAPPPRRAGPRAKAAKAPTGKKTSQTSTDQAYSG
jgi:hypothetical protein